MHHSLQRFFTPSVWEGPQWQSLAGTAEQVEISACPTDREPEDQRDKNPPERHSRERGVHQWLFHCIWRAGPLTFSTSGPGGGAGLSFGGRRGRLHSVCNKPVPPSSAPESGTSKRDARPWPGWMLGQFLDGNLSFPVSWEPCSGVPGPSCEESVSPDGENRWREG